MPAGAMPVPQQERPLTEDEVVEGFAGMFSSERDEQPRRREQPESVDENDEGETDEEQEPEHRNDSDDESPESDDEQSPENDDEEDAESEGGQDNEEQDEAQDEPPAKLHRVRSNGKDLDVTYDELKAGYSRTDDYTRKTQAISARNKDLDARESGVNEKRGRYDERLQQAEDALKVLMPTEPDWDAVKRENPDEYHVLYTDWQRYQGRLKQIQEERTHIAKEKQAEQSAKGQSRMREEVESLIRAVPEWQDDSKLEKGLGELFKGSQQRYGFEANELNRIADHRVLLLMRDALQFHALTAKQKDVAARIKRTGPGPVRTAKPGAHANAQRPRHSDMSKAISRLAKSGDIEDAAEAFFLAEDAERKTTRRRNRQ